jgi:hypothetical protein
LLSWCCLLDGWEGDGQKARLLRAAQRMPTERRPSTPSMQPMIACSSVPGQHSPLAPLHPPVAFFKVVILRSCMLVDCPDGNKQPSMVKVESGFANCVICKSELIMHSILSFPTASGRANNHRCRAVEKSQAQAYIWVVGTKPSLSLRGRGNQKKRPKTKTDYSRGSRPFEKRGGKGIYRGRDRKSTIRNGAGLMIRWTGWERDRKTDRHVDTESQERKEKEKGGVR